MKFVNPTCRLLIMAFTILLSLGRGGYYSAVVLQSRLVMALSRIALIT
jgi:hypothetical protein